MCVCGGTKHMHLSNSFIVMSNESGGPVLAISQWALVTRLCHITQFTLTMKSIWLVVMKPVTMVTTSENIRLHKYPYLSLRKSSLHIFFLLWRHLKASTFPTS